MLSSFGRYHNFFLQAFTLGCSCMTVNKYFASVSSVDVLNSCLFSWPSMMIKDHYFRVMSYENTLSYMHYHLRQSGLYIMTSTKYYFTMFKFEKLFPPLFITLIGQKVVVVRCELINISGSFYRNKRKCWTLVSPICPKFPNVGLLDVISSHIPGLPCVQQICYR